VILLWYKHGFYELVRKHGFAFTLYATHLGLHYKFNLPSLQRGGAKGGKNANVSLYVTRLSAV
jgi:hypothetical protein